MLGHGVLRRGGGGRMRVQTGTTAASNHACEFNAKVRHFDVNAFVAWDMGHCL